jgi:hypothetical protein
VRKWNKANPEKVLALRASGKFKKLGITAADYWRMFDDQDGRCASCGRTEPSIFIKTRTRFDIDHNHKTGEIRALLCQPCNLMVGLSGEDPDILQRVAKYLENHK